MRNRLHIGVILTCSFILLFFGYLAVILPKEINLTIANSVVLILNILLLTVSWCYNGVPDKGN